MQRVSHAQVTVDGVVTGSIDMGLVAFVGVHSSDKLEDVIYCVDKCVNLRIFPNQKGRFEHALLAAGGQVLAISQFTLYGDCRKGRRPFFGEAAKPGVAEPLYEAFIQRLRETHGVTVATGIFGAHMDVEIHNDGPVTLFVYSPESAPREGLD